MNRKGLNRQAQQVTLKPVPIFGRFKVTSSVVIKVNFEFNSTCRRKKHSLFHVHSYRCGRVARKKGLTITGMSIRTDLCQIRGEDLLCRKKSVQKDICGSVGHRQKVQTTTRPENVWPQVWTQIGNASQKREKQEWANEKPRLDNARRLGGIYFIDPDDRDHTETVKNARIQFGKTSSSSHAVQKISKWHHESGCEGGRLHPNRFQKTVHECMMESHESTRQRVESSQPKHHEEHHCKQRFFNSMTHYNSVHMFIPRPQMQKTAVDKEWKKVRDDPSMEYGKSQEQKGGYSGSTERQKESSLCFIDGLVSSEEFGVGATIPEVQMQSRAPW